MLIVCPLDFERRALRRAGLDALGEVTCCGPGAAAVVTWAQGRRPMSPVILCGVAGGLSASVEAGRAYAAAAVLGADGRRIEPTLPAVDDGRVMSSAPGTLATPQAKQDWARRTGADLVDLESAAFAELAAGGGWRWAVVRGVSDDRATALPPGIDDWVDARGRSRPGAVLRAVLAGRAGIGELARLRAACTAALRAAAALIERMLDDQCRDAS